MRKSNLTYEQLIELAPKDRPFQIEVESNAENEGGKQILWANIYKEDLDTCLLKQDDIDDFRYDYFLIKWKYTYKSTFTLIDEYRNMYEKPEVLEVGTEVEILESARDVDYYRTSHFDLLEEITKQIGELNIINRVGDDDYGIYYETKKGYRFPHYCVRPVEKVEEKEEKIITVNGKKYKLIEE